jgi:hypothetical protein
MEAMSWQSVRQHEKEQLVHYRNPVNLLEEAWEETLLSQVVNTHRKELFA